MDKELRFNSVTRRGFVASSLSVLGITPLVLNGVPAYADPSISQPQALTVQGTIDLILKEIPGGPVEKTVDTLKSGQADSIVKGIVTTMFSTVEIIKKAIDRNANFIIAHEPTFYNHLDDTSWLEHDDVYQFKRDLLKKHNIAVWRFHDYWHRHHPDGIRTGVLRDLDWEKYYDTENPGMINLPAATLRDIVSHLRNKLGIGNLRIVGDLEQTCRRILLMPGASGGRSQIQLLQRYRPDLLICGEVAEWETSEYMRDARAMGREQSLVVLGHAQSEEPGMEWLAEWLRPKVGGINVTHIASGNPFTFV